EGCGSASRERRRDADAARGRAERDVMLNAITLEGFSAAIVHVHWQRYGDGAFRIRRPLAIVLVDVQIICDDAKLLAGHLENFIIVNRRHCDLCRNLPQNAGLLFALVKWRRQLRNVSRVKSKTPL